MNAPTDRPQHARSETLGFVAPGLAHQLGNALFAVQGHAALLRSQEPEFLRERNGMLAAIERAEQALQVLQFLVGLEGRGPQQPGILLHRLAEMLRVSLREASLALELGHGSRQTPRPVAPAPFCRGVLAAVRHLTQACAAPGQAASASTSLPSTLAPFRCRSSGTLRRAHCRSPSTSGPVPSPSSGRWPRSSRRCRCRSRSASPRCHGEWGCS